MIVGFALNEGSNVGGSLAEFPNLLLRVGIVVVVDPPDPGVELELTEAAIPFTIGIVNIGVCALELGSVERIAFDNGSTIVGTLTDGPFGPMFKVGFLVDGRTVGCNRFDALLIFVVVPDDSDTFLL